MKTWAITGLALVSGVVMAVGCDGDDENPPDGSTGNTTTTTSQGDGGAGGSGGAGGGDSGTGGMGTGGTGTGGGTSGSLCEQSCAYLDGLGVCPNPDPSCAAECEQLYSVAPWCEDTLDTLQACGVQQPATSYECQNGSPSLEDGSCMAEGDAVTGCFEEGPAAGLPDMTADCQAYCDAAAGLACASASCLQECLDSMEDALPCNGAQAMTIHCFAQQPAASYECSQDQKPQPSGQECLLQVFIQAACLQGLQMP